MKALWDGDQDKLELGRRGNASIMDGATAAFDDISKFDDDGKLRRTGLNLSFTFWHIRFQRDYGAFEHYYFIIIITVGRAAMALPVQVLAVGFGTS